MQIYLLTGSIYLWFIRAFVWTALLTAPAILCLKPSFHTHFMDFCGVFGWVATIASLFGPVLIMPLFFILLLTQKLGNVFYPNDGFLILMTKVSLVFVAILSSILFVVPLTTLDVPYKIASLISYPVLRFLAEIILLSLWLAPAGMLYLLALFMVQFGFLPATINQGFKPILIYILSGGFTAITFGIFAQLLGRTETQLFIPTAFPLSVHELPPMVKALFNPYYALLLDFIAPLPMLFLFKKCITDKIKVPGVKTE